jgi:putative GTP pyrophosphokinase
MPKPATNIKSDLARLEPTHKQLKEETIFILESILKDANIKHHSISGRIKTAESTSDKLKRKQLTEPQQLNDLVGVRVVCLFLSDIKRIGDLIRKNFDVEEEDNKIEDQELALFGYMSFHFIAKIKNAYSGPRYDAIRNIPIEIQVRTIAMDAWAATSHYLDYKSAQDVPKELRKDFFALSGLFYVADQHFEMFFKARQNSVKTIKKELTQSPSGVNIEINLDTLNEYLKRRFSDRDHSDPANVSALVTELKSSGYNTIQEVDAIIKRSLKAALRYEKEQPPHVKKDDEFIQIPGGKYTDTGIVRGIFDIYDPSFAEKRGITIDKGKYRSLISGIKNKL